MSCSLISHAKTLAGSSVTLRNHIIDSNGDDITQASVVSISLTVSNITDITEEETTPAVVVSSVVFDSLQSWAETNKAGGFNASFSIPASSLPTPHHRYRAVFDYSMSSGEDFKIVWQIGTEG